MAASLEEGVGERWGTSSAWRTAHEQQRKLSGLLDRGDVAGLMLACRSASRTHNPEEGAPLGPMTSRH